MRKKHGLINRDTSETETNTMEGLSNLADVMLVLAVGIMLALIINWNVDISTPMTKEQVNQSVDTTDALEFSEDQMQQMSGDDEINDQNLTQLGSVYYDEKSGRYYIIKQ